MAILYRLRAILILLSLLAADGAAAAYQGRTCTYRQPDGGTCTVLLWGDEDYADEETPDGWRIVQDPFTRFWCYARLSADGLRLESTGMAVAAGDPATLGVARHLRIARDERLRLHRLNQRARHCDPRGRPLPAGIDGLDAAADSIVAAPPSAPTTGSRRGLTLLLRFPDLPGDVTISQAQVDAYCNQESGYTGFGNNGSVRTFFQEVSGGRLTYTNQVAAYVTAAHSRDYYTDETIPFGTQAVALITEALSALEASGFDFRTVDADGNGVIDALNCFYAGDTVNAWSKGLWPHASSMTWVSAATGVRTGRYQISDMGTSLSLGTFCHENGHMLCNFPDVYDYGYDSTGGAGSYCLMNSGGHGTNPCPPCGYLRYKAGWGTVTTITAATNTLASLTAQGGSLLLNQFLLYARSGSEYYLVENRWKSGRDAGLPTGGIAIWHVDQAGNKDDQRYAHQASHQNYEVALIQADNLREHERNLGSNAGDLYYSGNAAAGYAGAFNDTSDVSAYDNNAHWWDGTSSGLRLSGFSTRGNTMSLLVGGGAVVVTAPNGGQTLTGGTATTVTWSSYGTVGNVTIAVSTDAGGTWQDLLANTPNDGTQPVTLPVTVSSTCLMRVSQSAGSTISDTSDAFFTITGAAQEMDVARSGTRIADGGADTLAFSVVGVAEDLAYTIANPGGGALTLSAPVLSGLSNCTAAITVAPSASVNAGGTGGTTLRVIPTATGAWSVAVSVASNDADENPYNWTVSGTAVAQPVAVLKHGSVTIADGGSETLSANILGITLGLGYRLNNEAAAGSDSLDLTGGPAVVITGQVNCTALVTAQPVTTTAPGSNAPFTVQVTATAAGAWSYTAAIATNDADRNPYNWTTNGLATPTLAITSGSPLPDGHVGIPYSCTLTASGGTGTGRTWSVDDAPFTEAVSASGGMVGGGTARGWSGDEATWLYTLPFPFRFYGIDWTQVYVSSNGFLEFGADNNSWQPTTAELMATKRIAPLWADLVTDEVYITEEASRVVIRWAGSLYSNALPVAFEAILARDGTITFTYGATMAFDPVDIPVIGLSAGDSLHAILSARSGTSAITTGARAVFTRASLLPPGLTLASSGLLSGTPTVIGTTTFPAQVEDSAHLIARADLTVTISSAAVPDLDLQGGSPSTSIVNGDTTPATADGTSFGSVVVTHAPLARTFTIRNTGTATLTLTGATSLSLAGDAQFAVTAQPGSTSIPAGGSTTCIITLTPATVGSASTTLSLASNDPDEAPFTCTLAATILPAPPVITLQPQSQSIPTGSSATLTVTATGSGLAYQWYQGVSGDTTTAIAGATDASYTTPALTGGASYWVRISNPGGSVDSGTAAIGIQQPPVITVPPASLTITSGTTAVLNVTATGGSLVYQWYQGSSGDVSLPVAAATTATCVTPMLTATTGFWVRVGNASGSADSPTATVSIADGTATTDGAGGGGGGGGSCGLGSSITGLLAGLLLLARLRLRR